jgi:hypothetical protein
MLDRELRTLKRSSGAQVNIYDTTVHESKLRDTISMVENNAT